MKYYEIHDHDVDLYISLEIDKYIQTAHHEIITTKGKKKYINIPLAFDTETTSFRNQDNVKSVLLYSWQFAINDLCVYGRKVEDLPLLFDYLYKVFNSKYKELHRVVIYVHNLSFDYHFIHKFLSIKSNSVLAYDKRTVFYFELNRNQNTVIEFRCSYVLTQKKLKSLSDDKIRKEDPIDYDLARTPITELNESELKYNLYDVLVLTNYFRKKFNTGETLDHIPLTLTGYARNHLKAVTGFKLKKNDRTNEQKNYFKIVNNCHISDSETLNIYRSCFQGGFTHGGFMSNGQIFDDVKHIDFTSSYPTVLIAEKYPVSDFIKEHEFINYLLKFDCNMNRVYEKLLRKDVFKLRDLNIGYIVKIQFTNIELKNDKYEIPISISKILNRKESIIHSVYNGRVIKADNIIMWLTDVDYQIIKDFYNFEYSISDLRIANFDYLPNLFTSTILELYKDKTTLKGIKESETDYQLKKVILNSLYGLCVTDPITENFIYDDDLKEIIEKSNTDKEFSRKLFLYNRFDGKTINYMWGVFCTAYARYNLFTGIKELGSDYLYSDTDSLFFINYEKHKSYIDNYNSLIVEKLKKNIYLTDDDRKNISPKDIKGKVHTLGIWDYETDCKLFCSIGAKRYLQFYKSSLGDYDFSYTFAGVNGNNLKCYFLRKFERLTGRLYSYTSYDDALIIARFFAEISNGEQYVLSSEDSGKITSTYIDYNQSGTITDYQGNNYDYNSFGGVHLEKHEFTITRFTDITESFNNLSKLIHRKVYQDV